MVKSRYPNEPIVFKRRGQGALFDLFIRVSAQILAEKRRQRDKVVKLIEGTNP